MTKDGRWRTGSIGWCDMAPKCKHWDNEICAKCFKKDMYEERNEDDRTDD